MVVSALAIAIVIMLIIALMGVFSMYNDLVRSKKRVEEAWSGIDVQLRRRASLIPNLLETVKAYADHERGVFDDVTRARGGLQQAAGVGETANASNMLSQALGRLFAVVENYPQLRASENFMSLQNDLSDVEEKIAFARQFYNRNVLDYNTRCETYPSAIIARSFNVAPAEFFETDDAGRAEVRVTFARHSSNREQPAPPAA